MAKTKKAKKKNIKRKIVIEGTFSGTVNNHVILDVFRSNALPKPYDFRKKYEESFKETLDDLEPGLVYNIDFTGFTTTQFDLKISGEFDLPNPIIDSFQNTSFSPGYSIKIKS
jgi:hypothetical protein